MSPALLIVILAVIVLIWIGFKYATPRAVPISPEDPRWKEAVQRARATLPQLRELHQAGREVWVKFPLPTRAQTTEHVWGKLVAVENDRLRCTVETPPVAGRASGSPSEITVSAREIEDWQAELADGKIRGGFTTRAQAAIAKQQGVSVPRHVEEMIARMVD